MKNDLTPEELYKRMYDGMIAKDRALLSDVLDESFVLIHMTGLRQDKETFIRSVEDGTPNYYAAVHQTVRSDIQGDAAELLGRSVVSAAVFGGGRHSWRLQLKCKLTRRDDGWRFCEARASVY